MRVVLINDKLNAGGAEKMLVYIANLLHKNNIEVSVVLLLGEAALDSQINTNIPIHYLNRKSRFSINAFRQLKKHVQDADIVHVHSRYNFRYYMIAKFLMGINKPKIFFHDHGPSFQIDRFTHFLFGFAHAYVAVQDKMRLWAINSKSVKKERAYHLANTVKAPSESIVCNKESNKIVMVGNLLPIKNHLFAISLLAQLQDKYTMDIYGRIDDSEHYTKLLKLIEELHLKKRVKLIQGVSDIYSHLHQYKFALHTSFSETGPLVLVEYLYAQLPFLAYKTGDVVTVLEKHLPEFVIDNFNHDVWRMAIERFERKENWLLENEEMQQVINEHFSEKNYLKKLLGIYKQMVA